MSSPLAEVLAFPPHRMRRGVLLRKSELAERWGVSERWIELRVRDAGLPVQKDRASRLVRFDLADCEAWRVARLSA